MIGDTLRRQIVTGAILADYFPCIFSDGSYMCFWCPVHCSSSSVHPFIVTDGNSRCDRQWCNVTGLVFNALNAISSFLTYSQICDKSKDLLIFNLQGFLRCARISSYDRLRYVQIICAYSSADHLYKSERSLVCENSFRLGVSTRWLPDPRIGC